ncbi:MAG: OmpH family outer membrane protein [Verrucomicrobiota bacterium]
MKKLSLLLLSAFCLTVTAAFAQTSLKIAVIDMNRVLKEYYKTQEAEDRLKEVASGYQKEFNDRRESYSKLVDQIRALQEESKDASLSEAKRKEKENALKEKVKEAQIRDRENVTFAQTASNLVQEQRGRATKGIMEDIAKIVNTVSKSSGYNLVLVKGDFPSPVLYSDTADLSGDVIKELNKTQPPKKK